MKSTVKDLIKKPLIGKGPDKLWPMVSEYYDLGCQLRRPFEQRWLLNLSFLAGKQNAFYNESANMLQHLVQRKGRLMIVDNKILPRYQKQVSRLIRNHPRISVIPASTDQEDLKAAKLGDKVIKHFWRVNRMRKKIRELGGWIYSCGNGFLDDRWNPKLGPIKAAEDGKLYYLGDADCGVWSPLEVGFPASGITEQTIDLFPWMWKAKYRPLEWIRTAYPKRGKEVPAETRPIPFIDSSALFGGSQNFGTHQLEGAVVIELKIMPCGEFPRGKFLVGANGFILENKDYPFDTYHIEQFKDIEVPGVFWGMATTEAAIWLQKLWNRTLSDIAEYNRSMARGKWLIPRNSKMEVEMDDGHGQKILYSPVLGHKPEMMTIKGLPASYQQVLQIVMSSLMELYHQHEVTQGTNKSDIRSGEMVALLLEQDDFGNVPTHAVFEESLEAVMGRVLRRIQKGYKDERVIAVVGKDNEHDLTDFKGADLRNNTDVIVAKESSIPDSKVARQFRIKENYKEGLYGNPQDERTRERVLKMLDEVPDDVKDIFAETHLDRTNAQVENKAMLAHPGVQFLANNYDNHAVHLEEHTRQKKESEYQKLKIENPKLFVSLEVTFMTHEGLHKEFLAEQMKVQDERMAKMAKMEKGGGK